MSDTFTLNMAGRDVEFHVAKPGQLLILKRMVERIQKQITQETGTSGAQAMSEIIQRSLDLVESLVVDPADVSFLEEAMLKGDLDHERLMDVLKGPQEEEKPKKKAVAKRTPRVAKAAAPVASRGRTKR